MPRAGWRRPSENHWLARRSCCSLGNLANDVAPPQPTTVPSAVSAALRSMNISSASSGSKRAGNGPSAKGRTGRLGAKRPTRTRWDPKQAEKPHLSSSVAILGLAERSLAVPLRKRHVPSLLPPRRSEPCTSAFRLPLLDEWCAGWHRTSGKPETVDFRIDCFSGTCRGKPLPATEPAVSAARSAAAPATSLRAKAWTGLRAALRTGEQVRCRSRVRVSLVVQFEPLSRFALMDRQFQRVSTTGFGEA
jgi:hypothetical protein